ncbi:MAG: hypothetical protein Q9169_008397, partial [Polycauliona sp. 2 TL-2023]
MQYLPLLASLSTLLALTTGAPAPPKEPKIAAWAQPFFHPSKFALLDTKTGGCNLRMYDVFSCKETVVVDKTHKCGDLPKKVFKGNACGKGKWNVDNTGSGDWAAR